MSATAATATAAGAGSSLYQIAGAVLAVTILQLLLVTKAKGGGVELSKESRRRIQHATTGQLMICVSYILPLPICTVALLAGIVLLLFVYHVHNPWYKKTFGPLLRPSEQDTLPGAFWFLLGTWIIVTLVCVFGVIDIDVGRYAILCLSYADPMAAWVGSSISSPRIGGGGVSTNATVAGCGAAFVTALILGVGMLGGAGSQNGLVLPVVVESVIGALACTLAESAPLGNDNLLIPIGTALAVQLVRMYN